MFYKDHSGLPPPPPKKKKKTALGAQAVQISRQWKNSRDRWRNVSMSARKRRFGISQGKTSIFDGELALSLQILLTVCYTILIPGSMSWENFCIGSTNSHLIDIFQNFSSLVWLILYLWHKEKFCFIHLYHTLRDIKLIYI